MQFIYGLGVGLLAGGGAVYYFYSKLKARVDAAAALGAKVKSAL